MAVFRPSDENKFFDQPAPRERFSSQLAINPRRSKSADEKAQPSLHEK
tara:strand:+ start:727 stop:870 length:144 start_codon:yes stop_codon:yes gene_type:complete